MLSSSSLPPIVSVVHPLATPKGVKLTCDLCQKPARLQCSQCRVTYYCGENHQIEDWKAIHEKICEIVSALHSPELISCTAEEKVQYHDQQILRKRHIVGLALEEGKRLLYSGQASLAIPAALRAVRYLTDLESLEQANNIDIAPAYLVLSEAAIKLGRLSEAEQYLSQVQWLTLQSPSVPSSLLSSVHRNLGQLCAARGRLAEARRHFAEDVYQSSVTHGTKSPQTAIGYFHMANIFLREGQTDVATSLHNQVVMAWYQYFTRLQDTTLDTATQAEALYILQSICDLRQRSPKTPPTPLLYHTLAIIFHITEDNQLALEYEQKAAKLCCHDDKLYHKIQSFIKKLMHLQQ